MIVTMGLFIYFSEKVFKIISVDKKCGGIDKIGDFLDSILWSSNSKNNSYCVVKPEHFQRQFQGQFPHFHVIFFTCH